MKIGYLDDSYPNQRCIKDWTNNEYVKLNRALIAKIHDFMYRVSRFIIARMGLKFHEWNHYSFIMPYWYKNWGKIDLIHLFNYIPVTSKDWVCTFETNAPVTDSTIGRVWERGSDIVINDRLTIKLLHRCAKDNCKGLIALSQSAYNIQVDTVRHSCLTEEMKEKIEKKIYLLHPPQDVLISDKDLDEKNFDSEETCFIMIGHDFFRKGGFQVVNALEKMRERGYSVKLIIISKLNYGDYASISTERDQSFIKQKISKFKWIDYYESLPNEDTLELAQKADIGLLPSIAETYGYSALELMACGCPMVTTNIRALREINDNDKGWVCNIYPNQYGESIYADLSDLKKKMFKMYCKLN